MTGDKEVQVTYPQFYNLPDGDLLFVYREGSSGDGDTMLSRYDTETGEWQIVAHPLIDHHLHPQQLVRRLAVDRPQPLGVLGNRVHARPPGAGAQPVGEVAVAREALQQGR